MNENDLIGNVPNKDSDWNEISKYACSFNGYEYWGSFDEVSNIANKFNEKYIKDGTLPDSLELLRTSLFFEQRRFRHFGRDPSAKEMEYIRAILAKIRKLYKDVKNDM